MEVICGRRSSDLNPNAEPFVPVAYRTVEDYSPEWWQLVESCSAFRHYWLKDCFIDPQLDHIYDPAITLDDDVDDDYVDSLFFPSLQGKEGRLVRTGEELDIWGKNGKWRKDRAEAPRFYEKAPKFVNIRVSPRMIQQPK